MLKNKDFLIYPGSDQNSLQPWNQTFKESDHLSHQESCAHGNDSINYILACRLVKLTSIADTTFIEFRFCCIREQQQLLDKQLDTPAHHLLALYPLFQCLFYDVFLKYLTDDMARTFFYFVDTFKH